MRRRVCARRRRLAAASLLPALTALMITTAGSIGAEADTQGAEIKTSKRTVTYGGHLRLAGSFPDAPKQRVEIYMHRRGENAWKLKENAKTNSSGRFTERVRPPATADWRAELAAVETPEADLATAAPTDRRTGEKLIKVRSRTRAGVSERNIVRGRSIKISGRVLPHGERRKVVIRAGGKRLKTSAGRDGRFSRSWRPGGLGNYRIRAQAAGNAMAMGSSDNAGKVQVFRPVQASYYGPGFYGGRTACGQTLTTSTQGVAHKTLPCGTRVTLRYHGREVTVPVIDRGPYVAGREYDLTSATKNRLSFGSTGTVLSSR